MSPVAREAERAQKLTMPAETMQPTVTLPPAGVGQLDGLDSRRGGIAPPAHTRGEHTTDSWITPMWLIDRLGPFDLDPCECDPQPWPCAARGYTENGLLLPWDGFVWCNPPYGAAMKTWLNRLALHGNGIALVFARTETEAFFGHAWPYASAMLFLRGRLTFAYPDGSLPRNGANSGGPSVLIGYGEEAERRLLKCSDLGAMVKRVTTPNVLLTGSQRP